MSRKKWDCSIIPPEFLSRLDKPVMIDEVQRVPELFLAIKEDVDRNRQPGRYLLTGSANLLTLPLAADSLAGRMEIVTLHPLSQGEMAGIRGGGGSLRREAVSRPHLHPLGIS